MRILADLPDADIRWLDERAAELGKSRAALLREAVAAFRESERDWLEQGFGLWTRFGRGIDGSTYEAAIRAQWARTDAGPEAISPELAAVEAEAAEEAAAAPEPAEAASEPEHEQPFADEDYAGDDEEEIEEPAPRRGWFR
jgi:hypothetical protein